MYSFSKATKLFKSRNAILVLTIFSYRRFSLLQVFNPHELVLLMFNTSRFINVLTLILLIIV